MYVNIINQFIIYYNSQYPSNKIKTNIFCDLTGNNMTNRPMELFNAELEKFKNGNTEFKQITEGKLKKYILTKNSINYITSDSLIALLIEIINLENEDNGNFKIVNT